MFESFVEAGSAENSERCRPAVLATALTLSLGGDVVVVAEVGEVVVAVVESWPQAVLLAAKWRPQFEASISSSFPFVSALGCCCYSCCWSGL